MLALPGIGIIEFYVFVFLAAGSASHMYYRDVHHMLALVCADVTAIAVCLFLVIVFGLPNAFIPGQQPESCDVRKIGRMK